MDQLTAASLAFARERENFSEQKTEDSKNRLRRVMERKLKTSFIGAISKFENVFGRLWGHGKEYGQLTDSERRFRALWEQVRTEILNNGNNQIRAVQQELDLYTVFFDGYRVTLLPPEDIVG